MTTTLLTLSDEKCAKCKAVLEDDPGDKHRTSEGIVCSDCYFGKIGAEVEKNPIHSPGIHMH